MSDTTQQMAEEMYKRMSDYVGANHEENCVNFIKFALDSMETKLEEKEREVEVNEKAYLWEKEQKDLLKAENERLLEKYNELLMGVSMKFPDESRHETALRYIKQAEISTDRCSASLHKEKEDV